MGVMTDLVKKSQKRWGKKYIDTRNWPVYNEQLVQRGEYLLDLEWVQSWDDELMKMNANKVGSPYQFPKSMIQIQGIWHAKEIPYRMIEGITRRLYEITNLPDFNHYSTVNRRVNKLDIHLDVPTGDTLYLFSDGSGFQAIEGGEYLREKYGKKNRRWIQVIILGDPKTKEPVSFEVNIIPTSEAESTKKQLNELIENNNEIIEFGGDGSFDNIEFWKYLEEQKIRPIIKPDKNARDDSDSNWRNLNVKFLNEFGYEKWAKTLNYGKRWTATEGIFSAIKRIFGEQLRAKSENGMVQEAKMKVWAYKVLKRYGEAQINNFISS
jgi:hypothetical protein